MRTTIDIPDALGKRMKITPDEISELLVREEIAAYAAVVRH